MANTSDQIIAALRSHLGDAFAELLEVKGSAPEDVKKATFFTDAKPTAQQITDCKAVANMILEAKSYTDLETRLYQLHNYSGGHRIPGAQAIILNPNAGNVTLGGMPIPIATGNAHISKHLLPHIFVAANLKNNSIIKHAIPDQKTVYKIAERLKTIDAKTINNHYATLLEDKPTLDKISIAYQTLGLGKDNDAIKQNITNHFYAIKIAPLPSHLKDLLEQKNHKDVLAKLDEKRYATLFDEVLDRKPDNTTTTIKEKLIKAGFDAIQADELSVAFNAQNQFISLRTTHPRVIGDPLSKQLHDDKKANAIREALSTLTPAKLTIHINKLKDPGNPTLDSIKTSMTELGLDVGAGDGQAKIIVGGVRYQKLINDLTTVGNSASRLKKLIEDNPIYTQQCKTFLGDHELNDKLIHKIQTELSKPLVPPTTVQTHVQQVMLNELGIDINNPPAPIAKITEAHGEAQYGKVINDQKQIELFNTFPALKAVLVDNKAVADDIITKLSTPPAPPVAPLAIMPADFIQLQTSLAGIAIRNPPIAVANIDDAVKQVFADTFSIAPPDAFFTTLHNVITGPAPAGAKALLPPNQGAANYLAFMAGVSQLKLPLLAQVFASDAVKKALIDAWNNNPAGMPARHISNYLSSLEKADNSMADMKIRFANDFKPPFAPNVINAIDASTPLPNELFAEIQYNRIKRKIDEQYNLIIDDKAVPAVRAEIRPRFTTLLADEKVKKVLINKFKTLSTPDQVDYEIHLLQQADAPILREKLGLSEAEATSLAEENINRSKVVNYIKRLHPPISKALLNRGDHFGTIKPGSTLEAQVIDHITTINKKFRELTSDDPITAAHNAKILDVNEAIQELYTTLMDEKARPRYRGHILEGGAAFPPTDTILQNAAGLAVSTALEISANDYQRHRHNIGRLYKYLSLNPNEVSELNPHRDEKELKAIPAIAAADYYKYDADSTSPINTDPHNKFLRGLIISSGLTLKKPVPAAPAGPHEILLADLDAKMANIRNFNYDRDTEENFVNLLKDVMAPAIDDPILRIEMANDKIFKHLYAQVKAAYAIKQHTQAMDDLVKDTQNLVTYFTKQRQANYSDIIESKLHAAHSNTPAAEKFLAEFGVEARKKGKEIDTKYQQLEDLAKVLMPLQRATKEETKAAIAETFMLDQKDDTQAKTIDSCYQAIEALKGGKTSLLSETPSPSLLTEAKKLCETFKIYDKQLADVEVEVKAANAMRFADKPTIYQTTDDTTRGEFEPSKEDVLSKARKILKPRDVPDHKHGRIIDIRSGKVTAKAAGTTALKSETEFTITRTEICREPSGTTSKAEDLTLVTHLEKGIHHVKSLEIPESKTFSSIVMNSDSLPIDIRAQLSDDPKKFLDDFIYFAESRNLTVSQDNLKKYLDYKVNTGECKLSVGASYSPFDTTGKAAKKIYEAYKESTQFKIARGIDSYTTGSATYPAADYLKIALTSVALLWSNSHTHTIEIISSPDENITWAMELWAKAFGFHVSNRTSIATTHSHKVTDEEVAIFTKLLTFGVLDKDTRHVTEMNELAKYINGLKDGSPAKLLTTELKARRKALDTMATHETEEMKRPKLGSS